MRTPQNAILTSRFVVTLAISFSAAAVHFFLDPTASAQTAGRDRIAEATPTPTPKTSPTPIVEDDDIIRIDTELVNLNVRVIDRNNRPIKDLGKSEFTVLEDNIPQRIEFFSQSEVPTNYAIVVDNSGSLRTQINEVIEAGKVIVGTNKPQDSASVIRFVSSQKIEIVQDFTDNKADVIDALENLYIEGGRTAVIDAVYLAVQRVQEFEESESDRKRRALILVSDGEDVSSVYSQKQLFDLLKESDVQIFTVGFLRDLSDKNAFFSRSAQSKARSLLENLATQTGGKSYFPAETSELPGIARDIASEMRTQYSIGYIPSNDKNDGTYRNIKVVIADGPNKEKRIAVTRAGRTAGADGKPTLQRSN